ncbi:hypothetical protein AGLY_017113 [Aphis glycines]|uniref:Uncharacterized protein n=1 Tax=Aphis glycines TaxID=307491 RepID=A0A6G0SW13_APHGL|nr:hypothetical protein AGLY_017113 [Aphis glycines]
MAGPISEMNRLYKYVAPSSPSELIDCSNFTIDFENRKFLNIGFDPKDKFNIVLRIITPSRYVNISPDFLKRIYSFMGNILSHILDPAVKYKKFTFLECESVLITSMVYRGEHVLVVESKETSGCRILLNRRDLMTIQDLEWMVFETVSRKINIVRPNILNQLEQISEYFKTDFNIDKSATLDEVISIIRGIHIELIAKHIQKNNQSFLTQIILFATEQHAINWMTKSRNSNSQCVKMSVELFQSINTLLNNVNFRLPSHLLLKEFKLMSIEEINGFNILSIKCLQQDQNVQLTKENVKKILQLSDAMEEVIQMKNMYVRSASLLQACKISMFLGKEMPLPKDTKISDVEDYLEHVEVKKLKERISVQGTCLIADLKIKALKQLARGWLSSSPETEAEVNRPRTRAFVARERAKASRRLMFERDTTSEFVI